MKYKGMKMKKNLKREQEIFDKGYGAVRQMGREMVENGASLSDILFHANQIWHEFKFGSIVRTGQHEVRIVPGLLETGMYIEQYNPAQTADIIRADKRYANGADSQRVALYQEMLRRNPDSVPVMIVRQSAKAGK